MNNGANGGEEMDVVYAVKRDPYGNFFLVVAGDDLQIPVNLSSKGIPIGKKSEGPIQIVANALKTKILEFKKMSVITPEKRKEMEDFLNIVKCLSPTLKDKIAIGPQTFLSLQKMIENGIIAENKPKRLLGLIKRKSKKGELEK